MQEFPLDKIVDKEKYMKKVHLLFPAIVMAATCLFFSCNKSEKIVVATDATWPPMEFIDQNTKEIIGFDIDFMREIAKKGGFEVEFQDTAWDGIFAGLANNTYDAVISSVTITEERKKTMDFSDPYINAGQVLIVASGEPGSVKIIADLKGRAVGAQIGTTGAFEIEKVGDVSLMEYDELGLAIEDLVNGRIAGVVADTPIAADYVLQNSSYKGKLKIVGEPFTEEFYGIAVKKGNTELLKKINKGISAVYGTSIYAKMEDQWLR
ncbi:MAG: basic amino acid ABC transporter substrate-binding protein [Spirochaetales bacterium]|nr:basic amino acid ABC transporter substrate-binding protein [Spirochaetales bacterium]